ncbi:MAG: hypothetical protein ACTSWZ_06030, partial [Candidatus Heimdallarchaeaceae archaeon]
FTVRTKNDRLIHKLCTHPIQSMNRSTILSLSTINFAVPYIAYDGNKIFYSFNISNHWIYSYQRVYPTNWTIT